MATTSVISPAETQSSDQCVELPDIGWKGYTRILKMRGERRNPRLVYLDGNLFLMSPSYPHERVKKRLGLFVMAIVEEFDLPCIPAGQTTLRRRRKRGGVEGDETFYLSNESKVRGKHEINLRTDPPPDLAIEAVHTHDAAESVEVYRRLGVPEVWVCDDAETQILILQPNRSYSVSPASAAFPFLAADEIQSWVQRPQTVSETEWIKDLRRWVRETLLTRARSHVAEVSEQP
jgi:Uma2 family endonuclease